MEKEKYKLFKEEYLKKFRKYYNKEGSNKKELRKAVFDNPKLTEIQKRRFWELVKKRGNYERKENKSNKRI